MLEQLYQAAQNEDYSKISLLISSEEADTIIWSNLGIDDSISYPEENGIQMQIYIKPVYDDSVYDEERGYWYLGTGVYYGNLVNGKKKGVVGQYLILPLKIVPVLIKSLTENGKIMHPMEMGN